MSNFAMEATEKALELKKENDRLVAESKELFHWVKKMHDGELFAFPELKKAHNENICAGCKVIKKYGATI